MLVVGLSAPAAAASAPNQAFAGRIMLSEKRFPTGAKSGSAYVAQVRKMAATSIRVNKETNAYKLYYAAFLRQPLNAVAYTLKFYDVTDRQQRLVASMEQFADRPGVDALLSNVTLDKRQVGVNRTLLMTVEQQGETLASTRFKVLGETERYTGKVEFSDEEPSEQ